MKRGMRLLALMIVPLALIVMVSSCHSAIESADDKPDGSGLQESPSWVGIDPKELETEGDMDDENKLEPAEPGPELPLDLDISIETTKIQLGPFFGPLPELYWSPDGRYLAVFGERNGYGIWLWDQQTKSCRRLVHLLDRSGQRLTSLACFGWDSSGSALIYAVDGIQSGGRHLGQNGVLVRQVDVNGADEVLAWLPGEGLSIHSHLFDREHSLLLIHRGRDLWAVDTVNKCHKQVKSDLPTWDGLFSVTPSPTGKRVVYPDPDPDHRKLILLDLDNGTETSLGVPGEYPFHPIWSPDGKKLAFLSAKPTRGGYDFLLGEGGPLPPATGIVVVSKAGQPLMAITPPQGGKAGAPVWSPGSDRLAFLTGNVMLGPDGFMEVNWNRLLVTDLKNRVQDLGPVSGDWLIIGGFTPDGSSILVFAYGEKGEVLALLQSESKSLVLVDDAVDESPIWWQQYLVLPRIASTDDDCLDTQLYLSDFSGDKTRLTGEPGWKSGAQISSQDYLAYVNADNQNYPYPLLVVIQPLSE